MSSFLVGNQQKYMHVRGDQIWNEHDAELRHNKGTQRHEDKNMKVWKKKIFHREIDWKGDSVRLLS